MAVAYGEQQSTKVRFPLLLRVKLCTRYYLFFSVLAVIGHSLPYCRPSGDSLSAIKQPRYAKLEHISPDMHLQY